LYKLIKEYIMNEYSTFSAGVADATADSAGGYCPPADHLSLDFLVAEFRGRLACSDSYLAGYLSVVFAE
jgi:hypothetical protein